MVEPATTETVVDDRPSSDGLLAVEDLRTRFTTPAGVVKAVDGVSFQIDRGATLGVVGESGSGKTVLARSIMRLNIAANVETTGSVRYDGTELLDLSSTELRKLWGAEIAMVFQDPMTSLNPVVKVGRQLTEHLRHHLRLPRSEARATAIELLRSVRIPEPETRMSNYPHELSGGMRQRVCIAIALACGPKVLLADEPTTALDVTVQHQILNLLAAQQRERHMTTILVTHDLGVVAGRTDEIAVMYAGRIVERAPTRQLFAGRRHPYTESLLRAVPKADSPKHSRLHTIIGHPPDLISPPPGCSFAPRCPYAHPRCHDEAPPLTPARGVGPSHHHYSCWYPVGSQEGLEAYQRNLADRLPQTLAAEGRIAATEEMADPRPLVASTAATKMVVR
jgi:peptide/nickel transport system ATP-binding protein